MVVTPEPLNPSHPQGDFVSHRAGLRRQQLPRPPSTPWIITGTRALHLPVWQ